MSHIHANDCNQDNSFSIVILISTQQFVTVKML